MRNLCCLIPAYNEEKTIASVIEGCKRYISDIIVVDDGSTDLTKKIAKEKGVVVISHKKNMGKGVALKTGFSYALRNEFDALLSIDADGQHDPNEIPNFINTFKRDNSDIIIGARLWQKENIPAIKYLPNKVGVYFISKAAGQEIADTQSGFRLYTKKVLESVDFRGRGFEAETELLIKASRMGLKITCFPIKAIYPENYKSNFRPVRDFIKISLTVIKTMKEV